MAILEYRYIVAAIYAIVLFLDRLDLTIVNIALPKIAEHFKIEITETEWINNAFLLALALSIPISGWAADRWGDKRIFMLAILMFGLASLCCGLAPSIDFLIVMRFIQGLAGGLIVPVGMSMVFRAFDPKEYASISSYIFIPSLIAPAISPTLGGFMITYFSWKWVFLFATPICAITLIGAGHWLKEYKLSMKTQLDGWGFVLLASALLLIFYVLSGVGNHGLSLQNIMLLGLSLVLGYAFIQQERGTELPLVELGFFNNILFVQANLIQMLFQIGHFGSIFLISIFLQIGLEYSPMQAGMIMGMQAVGSICTSRLSVQWFQRYSAKLPIMLGLAGIGFITPMILILTPNS
ncbi:MAG TPA: MFS transporter, partial [Legionellaceae bacterium]|nr:MFS transporter [Legionellaceae bacterium]